MAHAAAGGVGHLGILEVIARIREQVVIAGVIPMHVGRDHMIDMIGLDAERFEPVADRLDDLAAAFLGGLFVKTGIDHEGAVRRP